MLVTVTPTTVTASVTARPVSVTARVTPRVTTATPAWTVTMATRGRRPSCVGRHNWLECNCISRKGWNENGDNAGHDSSKQRRLGAKTIKKNTNSTQNKSQTNHAKQYKVTSFLSTDCELSTDICSKNVYSLGRWARLMDGVKEMTRL